MASVVRDAVLSGAFNAPDAVGSVLKGFGQGQALTNQIQADRLSEQAASGDQNALLRLARYAPREAMAMQQMIQAGDQQQAQKMAQERERMGRFGLGWLQTPKEQRGDYLMQVAQQIQGEGGDISWLSQFLDQSPEQQELQAQNAIRSAVDFNDAVKQAFPEQQPVKPTSNMQDYQYYRQLQQTDPAGAEEFAIQAGIKERAGAGGGAPKPTTSMREFDRWAAMPEGPQKEAYGRLIGINPETKAPAGYRVTADGNLEPIPGGPADQKMQMQMNQNRARVQEQIAQTDTVLANVDRAIGMVNSGTAGLGGAFWNNIPGSNARDLRAVIDSIQSNLGFDKLQKMREQSPTGGALGSVSERELQLLNSSVQSLDPTQSPDQLSQNLGLIKVHYENFKNALMGSFEEGGGQNGTVKNWGDL